jgi:hypothetical protein
MTEPLNTAGLTQVGEVESRTMRESRVEEDYRNAFVAGGVTSLEATASFTRSLIGSLGRYDDPRQLNTLLTWIADRIREIQSPKGDPDATP